MRRTTWMAGTIPGSSPGTAMTARAETNSKCDKNQPNLPKKPQFMPDNSHVLRQTDRPEVRLEPIAFGSNQRGHCERSEAIQGDAVRLATPGSPRRHSPSGRTGVFRRPEAPRDDDSVRTQHTLARPRRVVAPPCRGPPRPKRTRTRPNPMQANAP